MKKVKIEKKVQEAGRYSNFKIKIYGLEAIYVSFDSIHERWTLDTKKFFKGDIVDVSEDKKNILEEFAKFLQVFEAYEYTLSSRRNFFLSQETTETLSAEEAWESDDPCYYSDYDYRKEVSLSSIDSLWSSKSNISIYCQFIGHVTNEGGNNPLQADYLEKINFIHCTLEANPESMKKRLGQVIDPVVIDGNNDLAVAYFVYKVLPTYYMLAFM